MSADWPRVPLGSVLRKSNDWIALDPNITYREVTVKLWGKGVTTRRESTGAEIAAAERVRVRANQFILSRIDARNGAFGLIPPELDGAVVSTDFPVFTADAERLDPSFLNWMSKTATFVDLCKAASEGTTNRVRLKEDKFLATPIPLPPLAEQRRIVARVEAVAARVAQARRLREGIESDQSDLVASMHLALSGENRVTLDEVFALDEERVPIEPACSYPQVGVNGFGGGLFAKEAVPGTATTYKIFNRLYPDAVVLSQVKGWEGAVAVCPHELSGRYVSPEYRTFRCRPGKADPGYVSALVSTPWFWKQLGSLTRGVGARRERIRPELFLNLSIPFPSFTEQQQAAKGFKQLTPLRSLQAETAADLDALLPAVLAKAFAGEL